MSRTHADAGSFHENGRAIISGHARRTPLQILGLYHGQPRIFQHKSGEIDGFTKKYKCDRLVYYEQYDDVYVAKRREQQLKGWRRDKKDCAD